MKPKKNFCDQVEGYLGHNLIELIDKNTLIKDSRIGAKMLKNIRSRADQLDSVIILNRTL